MRWHASQPPPKSRQSSPAKLSTACSTGSVETASECDSSDPAVEVMVNGPRSLPGFPRDDGGDGSGDLSRVHEEYRPEPLSSQQREELRRRNMDALHTPIVGETPEARALEEVRLANLAERTRLENLQHALDERARQRIPESSRRQLFRLQVRYTELRFRISQMHPE